MNARPAAVPLADEAALEPPVCPYCGHDAESLGSCKVLCRRCRRVIGTCGD